MPLAVLGLYESIPGVAEENPGHRDAPWFYMARSCMSTRERVSHLVGERLCSAGGSMSWLWPTRSRRQRPHVGHGVRIVVQGGLLVRAAAALHQLQRGLPELQLLLAGHGVALGAPPAT